jgi:hypothetical protein
MERRRHWSLREVSCPHKPRIARARRWTHLLGFVVTVAVGTGCGPFFGRPEPSGLGTGPITNACTWESVEDDCAPNEFCDAPDCKSPGSCVERPAPSMTGELSWVCGCDGVTYGNVAFARAQGVTAPTIGQCTGPSSGGGVAPAEPRNCTTKACPAGAVCLPLASLSCGAGAQSYCWAWPNDVTCTPGAQTGYLSCSGSTTCMTECEAITSMRAYRMATIGCR